MTLNVFFDYFGTYLESIILSPEPLIITGDFNTHIDDANDSDAHEFLDLLASMGLKNPVMGTTHEHGHTLDLVNTREHENVIKSVPVIDRYISDHAAVLCRLNSVKLHATVRETSYRQLKSIDMDVLRADLVESDLCSREFTDLDELATCYNSTLSSLLDKHATLKSKTIVNRSACLG